MCLHPATLVGVDPPVLKDWANDSTRVFQDENDVSPSEVSSKKPVSVLREVIPPIRKKAIDPRFDRSFGHYNEDLFKKSYGFVADIQNSEQEALRNALRTEKNPMRKEHVKKTLDRIVSMKRSNEIKAQQQRLVRDHRKMEAKLVEQGKTPYFLKQGDYKKLKLVEEFDKVKKRLGTEADLDKFIEKKRKRKASKQKKFMPDMRTNNNDNNDE